MAHRFTAAWSCFLIAFDYDEDRYNHELRYMGRMDLVFKPNGELYRGTLQYPDEEPLILTGFASIGVGERSMRLVAEEVDDFFEGTLTFESDDQTSSVVTGKVHFGDKSRLKNRLLKAGILPKKQAQDDPPWVITKP
jgi:hypothetical protein